MEDKIIKLQSLGKMCVTIGEIPASYKISMTYEEQLMWLCNFLENDVIKAINTNAEILMEVKDTVDNFNDRYEELNTKLEALRIYVNSVIIDINNKVELELSKQYNKILLLMNEYQAIFTNQLNIEVQRLDERINNIEIGQINVYNPTTGSIENINKVLNDIYDSVRYDALTVNEFEALNYTATGFDNVEITAYNFDNNGKSILS